MLYGRSNTESYKLKPARIKVKRCHCAGQRLEIFRIISLVVPVACMHSKAYDMSSELSEIEQLINYLEPNLLNNVEFAKQLIM